jgi:hypothetical protein
VSKGIENLRSEKYPLDGGQHKIRPMFWRVKKDPGIVGHFLIEYEVSSNNRVTVTSIEINTEVLFGKDPITSEHHAMYKVDRVGKARFDERFKPSPITVGSLKTAWRESVPVIRVDTEYAAVNGMLNDFEKAVWLMGVHLDTAYKAEKFNEYTLFHNTSQHGLPDFYESVRDKLGFTTENAKRLAAVLQQIQVRGKPVKWIAHSQGAIIFKEAIRHHLKHIGGYLSQNSVVLHAGGHKKVEMEALLKQVGIQKNNPDLDNPFDPVPALAGGNDVSLSAAARCLPFWRKLKGWGVEFETESPHTLPFQGLEFYRRMLVHAGNNRGAKRVEKHMKKTGIA